MRRLCSPAFEWGKGRGDRLKKLMYSEPSHLGLYC